MVEGAECGDDVAHIEKKLLPISINQASQSDKQVACSDLLESYELKETLAKTRE